MQKCRYTVRPAYGAPEHLVELLPASADDAFLEMLLGVLRPLNVKVTGTTDLWMNDEVLLHCESSPGPFVISKDVWDLVFIMAPENQLLIAGTDELLAESGLFEKQCVDERQCSGETGA